MSRKRRYSSNDCLQLCLFISMTLSLTQYLITYFANICPSNIRLWEPKTSVSSTWNLKKTLISESLSLMNRCSLIDFYLSQISHFPAAGPFVQNWDIVLDINYTCNIMCLVEANLTAFVLVTLCVYACVCRCMWVAKSELNSAWGI